MREQDGTQRLLYSRVCLPEGKVSARIVVINHGTGPARLVEQPQSCTHEAPEWFLRRGYAVMMPMRRGFGNTGGTLNENLVTGPSTGRRCNGSDPYPQGLEAARDIAAAVDYATALPGVQPDKAVVLGVSTGGYATIAYASTHHPKVNAIINVSGGKGSGSNRVCAVDQFLEAVAKFGETSRTPMLWVYAHNDLFFSPDYARSLHTAFTGTGGQAEFVNVGLYGFDGHSLFFGWNGSALWGPPVDHYLNESMR